MVSDRGISVKKTFFFSNDKLIFIKQVHKVLLLGVACLLVHSCACNPSYGGGGGGGYGQPNAANDGGRIKLNFGLNVPPVTMSMPGMTLPEIHIGADLIDKPPAAPGHGGYGGQAAPAPYGGGGGGEGDHHYSAASEKKPESHSFQLPESRSFEQAEFSPYPQAPSSYQSAPPMPQFQPQQYQTPSASFYHQQAQPQPQYQPQAFVMPVQEYMPHVHENSPRPMPVPAAQAAPQSAEQYARAQHKPRPQSTHGYVGPQRGAIQTKVYTDIHPGMSQAFSPQQRAQMQAYAAAAPGQQPQQQSFSAPQAAQQEAVQLYNGDSRAELSQMFNMAPPARSEMAAYQVEQPRSQDRSPVYQVAPMKPMFGGENQQPAYNFAAPAEESHSFVPARDVRSESQYQPRESVNFNFPKRFQFGNEADLAEAYNAAPRVPMRSLHHHTERPMHEYARAQ